MSTEFVLLTKSAERSKMNITQYINNLEYINATAEQIKKDFDLFGLEIKFSGNEANAYDELLYQIVPHISQLAETNYKKLLDLLYRIDVPEGKVADCVNNENGMSMSEGIAENKNGTRL